MVAIAAEKVPKCKGLNSLASMTWVKNKNIEEKKPPKIKSNILIKFFFADFNKFTFLS